MNKIFEPIQQNINDPQEIFRKTQTKFINSKPIQEKSSILTAKQSDLPHQQIATVVQASHSNQSSSEETIKNQSDNIPPKIMKKKLRNEEELKDGQYSSSEQSKKLNTQFFSQNSFEPTAMLSKLNDQNEQLKIQMSEHKKVMQATITELKNKKLQKVISTLKQVKDYQKKMNLLEEQKEKILEEHQLSLDSIL